jgi:hypothetical protein
MDVGVVIRFVAMEIILRERLAQEKRDAKPKMEKRLGAVYKPLCAATMASRVKFAGSSSVPLWLLLTYAKSISYGQRLIPVGRVVYGKGRWAQGAPPG